MSRRSAVLLALLGSACSGPGTRAPDARLEAFIASRFPPGGPGGVVLVARGADPILRRAYGFADVEAGRPMRADQPLPIGSLTKSFTAAAILRLSEVGELLLDDDVRAHVPSAPVGQHRVTPEQLLTHTSGIPSLVDEPGFLEWAREPRSSDELLARSKGLPFLFEPGRGFAYSDTGYILLGAVLERHLGTSWDRAVRDLVTEPLGLRSVRSAADVGAGAAVGYEIGPGGAARAEPLDWSVPHASGALAASADDLLRWVLAWRGGAVVSARLAERAWSERELPGGIRSGYGFGWKRCDFEGRTSIQHGGWVPGFTAALLHLPDEDLTAICLTNADGGVEASYVARQALRLLLTGSPEPRTIELSRAQAERLCGRYRSGRGAIWTVSRRDGGLVLDLGGGPIALAASSPWDLSAADSDGTWLFAFEEGEDGSASAVAVSLTCEPQGRAHRIE